MALVESSRLWTTGGAGDGASTYTRDQFAEAMRNAFLNDFTTQGVFNGLAVSGTASPLTLATGAALVYGFFYFCTTSGSLGAIATPSIGTTGWHVVLRADWTAQTVRAVAVRSADGTSTPPAVTQSAGSTWEIRIATGTITTAGVIAVTDARQFTASPATKLTAGSVVFAGADGQLQQDNASLFWDDASNRLGIGTTAPGATLEVAGDVFVLDSGSDPRIVIGDSAAAGNWGHVQWNSSADELRLGTSTGGDTVKISEGGVVTLSPASATPPIVLSANGQQQTVDGLAADEIDTLSFQRQGGSGTDWNSTGTSNFTPTTMRMQAGRTITGGGGSVTVTFPVAFSNKPIIVVSASGGSNILASISSVSASQFTAAAWNAAAGTSAGSIGIDWIAVGPE